VKGGDDEEEGDVDAAAALPHAVTPVRGSAERVLLLRRIAAAAPGSLREAAGRRKRTATRLLRCRARLCP
jgi:hypothetical protein